MTIELTIPDLGESVEEAVLGAWLKKQGEHVEQGETLIEIETDKVVLEIPAPQSGVLSEIVRGDNETVKAGDVIGHLEASDAAVPDETTGKQADAEKTEEQTSGTAVDLKIPDLGESVEEAALGAWLKKQGDAVTQGETLIEIETDKVVLEIPAPETGVLTEIIKSDNETVKMGDVIARIQASSHSPDTESSASKHDDQNVVSASISESSLSAYMDDAQEAPKNPAKTSPAVRKLMLEEGVSANDVTATGKDGTRITKQDVLSAKKTPNQPTSGDLVLSENRDERVPMTPLRKRIAQRLVSVQQDYAMLTTFNEVDLSTVKNIRAQYKDQFKEVHGTPLGFMSFFVLAVVEALKEYPIINASVSGEDILYHRNYNISVAVSTDKGLVVPVLRNAESMTMAEIEIGISSLAEKARNNALTLDDLSDGTFTITNGGVFGSMMSTPIINPPQSAILGMHAIQDRPVVVDGEIVIRPMMYLALSYDHRIIDGAEAVQFLKLVKDVIEAPTRLLLHL